MLQKKPELVINQLEYMDKTNDPFEQVDILINSEHSLHISAYHLVADIVYDFIKTYGSKIYQNINKYVYTFEEPIKVLSYWDDQIEDIQSIGMMIYSGKDAEIEVNFIDKAGYESQIYLRKLSSTALKVIAKTLKLIKERKEKYGRK